jgi:hypothetical protein
MKPQSLMSMVGIILSSVLASAKIAPQKTNRIEDERAKIQVAALLEDMIRQGFILVDPKTGKMMIKDSISDILKYYNVMPSSDHAVTVAGGCSDTTGGNGCDQ